MSASVIDRFRGNYRFLSNFAEVEVELPRGLLAGARAGGPILAPSVEHGFQACKTLDARDRGRVLAAPTAGEAKRLGQLVTLRPDWEAVKLVVTRALLTRKFPLEEDARNAEFSVALVATGDALLVEGNHWHDTYWGVCRCADCGPSGAGSNWLGHLLMARRAEVRATWLPEPTRVSGEAKA